MSCSARLPIYVLFSGMFFEKSAGLVAFSMYVTGMAIAILTALIMKRIGICHPEKHCKTRYHNFFCRNARDQGHSDLPHA